MILGIHHAQVTIPTGSEALAREFYCDLLGLPEIEKPASLANRGGFWAQAGDTQLHLAPEDTVDRRLSRAHLAYEVDDIDAYRSLLTSHGFSILPSIPIPGYERFEFRDPFGNRVEIIQSIQTAD